VSNASVGVLRAFLRGVGLGVDQATRAGVNSEAEALAAQMRVVASAHNKSGATVKSIAVMATNDPNKVRVVAGGDLTTKTIRKGSGIPYDYVRAEEFGTSNERAIPFFYNTYRARKRGIRQRIVARAAAAVK
jgi:HK97 gp10 family phage protein